MANIARADVSVHADTSAFLTELAALKKAVESQDWFIKVHPILDDNFKDDLQKQLSKIKGLEVNVGSDLPEIQKAISKITQAQVQAQKNILSEENQLNTALAKEANARRAILSEQVSQQKKILDLDNQLNTALAKEANARSALARAHLNEVKALLEQENQLNAAIQKEANARSAASRASINAAKELLEAENQLNASIQKEANARNAVSRAEIAAAKAVQQLADLEREFLKDEIRLNQAISSEKNAQAAADRAAIVAARRERDFLQEQLELSRAIAAEHNAESAQHRAHINSIKAENAEEKEMVSLLRSRFALENAIRRESERRERVLRREGTTLGLTVREWRFLAVKILGVRRNLDVTLKAYLLNAAASESMLTAMTRLFRASLNLRRSALQFGTAFATGFAAATQATGALLVGLTNVVAALQVAAGLGIIAVGVKFALKDPEVKAAADAAGAAFSEVMSNAVREKFNPALKQIFTDFQTSIKALEPSLKRFFEIVSPAVARLGKQFNDLIASPKFGQFIRDLGQSTANFLEKINLDAIFDGFIKIRDALSQSRELIKEAFGPGIFSGLTADKVVAGIQNLTAALVRAGPGIRAFKKAFGEALSGVGDALEGILATIGDVGEELFGALGPIARQVAKDVGQVIEALIRFASVVLPKVEENLKRFSDVFSDELETALEIFDEPFANTLNGILELGERLAPLLPIFARIAAALEPIIGAALELAKIIAPIAESFFDQIADVLEEIKPALEFVERKLKELREFLERHPSIQTWIGRIAAILAIGVISALALLFVFKQLIRLGRGFIALGKAIASPRESAKKLVNTLKEFGKKRLGLKVEVEDDDLDELRAKLNDLIKNKNINVNVDVDDDELDALKSKISEVVSKEIKIEVDLDLSELKALDSNLAKERILKIRCVKEGDCDCGDDDGGDDDDDGRKRKPRPKGPKGPKGGGRAAAPRNLPPPIPKSTTDSYKDFGDAVDKTDKPISKFDSNVKGKLVPSIGRAVGKTGIGALVAVTGLTLFHSFPDQIDTLGRHLDALPGKVATFKEELASADGFGAKFNVTMGFLKDTLGSFSAESLSNTLGGLNLALKDLTGIDVGGIIDGISQGLDNGDWSGAATAIQSSLSGAVSLLPGGETISGIVEPIVSGVAQGFATGDWSAAGSSIVAGLSSNFPTISAVGGPMATGVIESFKTGDWSHALDGFKTAADNALEIVKGKFNSFKETISGLFSPEKIEGRAVPVGGGGVQKAAATTAVDPAIAQQAQAIVQALQAAKAQIQVELAAIKALVSQGFTGLGAAIAPGLMGMVTQVTTSLQALRTVFSQFFTTALPEAVNQGMATLTTTLTTGLQTAMTTAFSGLGAIMSGLMTTAFSQANQGAVAGMAGITQVVAGGVQGISFAFNQITPVLGQAMTAAMQAALVATTTGIAALVAAVIAGVNQIRALASHFYSAGQILGQRLADGLRSKIGEVRAAASELAGAAAGAFNSSPAKFGPLAGHGDAFFRGREFVTRLIKGLLDKKPELREKVIELAREFERFRDSKEGVRLRKELERVRQNIRVERNIGPGGSGFGFGFGGAGGAAGGQLSGRFNRNIGGRILTQDTQASLTGRAGMLGGNLIQIRPGNIHVTLAGINDPREFLNALSKELMTNCVGR